MKAEVDAKIQATQARVDAIAENHNGRTIADQFALLSIVREKIDRAESFVVWANDRMENHEDRKVEKARDQAKGVLIRWEDHQEALMKNINKVLLQDLPIEKPTFSYKNRHEQYREWVMANFNMSMERAKKSSRGFTEKKVIDEVVTAYADQHLDQLTAQFPGKNPDDLTISPSTVRRYLGFK